MTINPDATPVQGNIRAQLVLDITSLVAPSLATEINDASSLDVTYFLRDFNPQIQRNNGNAPARLGTTIQLPVEGNTQLNALEVRYIYDPQGAPSADENKLLAALPRGTEFYLVVRKGLDGDTAWAASQYVEVWRFRAGQINKDRSGQDEFSEFEVSQQWFPLAEPTEGQVAA
jgi:hypothetical protein